MKYIFDENGNVVNSENTETLSQFSQNANTLYVAFKGISIRDYIPYIIFERADGKTSPFIAMSYDTFQIPGDVFVETHNGCSYSFSDSWVTAVAGALKFNVVLKKNNVEKYQGIVTLNVTESVDGDKITYIDDVAYNQLVSRMADFETRYATKEELSYGDRTYVKFSHLTANNTIENLIDALVDYNYIGENNVEYKFYIELGDGTILENIHINSNNEYYDITSIIRNGYDFKTYIGRMWYNYSTPTIAEFITQHSQIVNYKDIENFVNSETLSDIVNDIEEKIPYGDRTYYYSFNLTADNTVRELVDELKSYEMFDEDNEGKFYIKLSDDTILENIHIKWTYSDKTHFTIYYITSIIRESDSIKIYANSINRNNSPTISELIAQHKEILDNTVDNLVNYYLKTETYTKEEVLELIGNVSTLNLQPVDTLPTENISTTTIYLLNTNTTDETNIYEEWIYVNNRWELIGTTKVDLSGYALKTELFSKSYNDLTDKPTIPTATSQLTNDSEFINQTQLDEALANAGGSGASDKEVIKITEPLLIDRQDEGIEANFDSIEFDNKYIVWDWAELESQLLNQYQPSSEYFTISLDFSEKKPKNATLLIKNIPDVQNARDAYYHLYFYNSFIFVKDLQSNVKTFAEGWRYFDEDHYDCLIFKYENWEYDIQHIKIDFDEFGLATVYLFNYYEV